MNSLPLISHHLFVAAVASEERAPARPAVDAAPRPSAPRRDQELEQESNPDAWYAAASAARRAKPHGVPRGS